MLDAIRSFNVPELLDIDTVIEDDPDLEQRKLRGLMAIHNHLLSQYTNQQFAHISINAFFRDIVEARLFTLAVSPEALTEAKLTKLKLLAQFFSMTIQDNPRGVDYVHDLGESIADIDYWLRFEFIKLEAPHQKLQELFTKINQAEILFEKQQES